MMALTDRLEDRGFVIRKRSSVDRRRQELYLTPSGQSTLPKNPNCGLPSTKRNSAPCSRLPNSRHSSARSRSSKVSAEPGAMISKCARVEREGEIALVIVHNPPVNTITAAVRAGLRRGARDARQAKIVRAVVLLCEGSTFFSGADIGEFAGPPKEAEYRALFNGFEALAVPVVAAMHGTVHGRRPRDRARLPLPRRRAGHALRHARSHARHHSGRRRHAAHAAADRRRKGARVDPFGAAGRRGAGAGARVSR